MSSVSVRVSEESLPLPLETIIPCGDVGFMPGSSAAMLSFYPDYYFNFGSGKTYDCWTHRAHSIVYIPRTRGFVISEGYARRVDSTFFEAFDKGAPKKPAITEDDFRESPLVVAHPRKIEETPSIARLEIRIPSEREDISDRIPLLVWLNSTQSIGLFFLTRLEFSRFGIERRIPEPTSSDLSETLPQIAYYVFSELCARYGSGSEPICRGFNSSRTDEAVVRIWNSYWSAPPRYPSPRSGIISRAGRGMMASEYSRALPSLVPSLDEVLKRIEARKAFDEARKDRPFFSRG